VFDFRRATVFFGIPPLKAKMNIYSKSFGGAWPLKWRCFTLCEKKHEWICSSASFEISIMVRDCVCHQCAWVNSWIKLRWCRLLFTQIQLRGLLDIPLWSHKPRLVGKLLIVKLSSDFWASAKCKAILAVASFHNSSTQFLTSAWCSNFSKF